MSDIAIEIEGLDKLRAYFKRAPELTRSELTKAVHVSALVVQRMARKEAPVDRGILQNSIDIKFLKLGARVSPSGAARKYALAVHEGSKPHFPPIKDITGKEEPLDLWARRHGIPVWAVARSIARKGTKANPFMKRAAQASEDDIQRAFQRAANNITKEVER